MFSISRKNFKMADENAWEPLVETLTKSFSNLSPQILPGMHGAKKVLQALQSGLNDPRESRAELEIHCKWCGKVVSKDSETLDIPQGSVKTVERILTWHIDWTKRILKIKGAEFCCQDCHLLLNLAKLLNFLLSSDNSLDSAKLYSLASHFCQINGHTSQSGEDDIMLLQQAVSVVHSLHVLTKNMPDLQIQGPDGKSVTLDTVCDVLNHFSPRLMSSSSPRSASKTKQKRIKAKRLNDDLNITKKLDSSMTELKTNSIKKKKMGVASEPHGNGNHTSDDEGAVEDDHAKETFEGSAKRKHLIVSGKRKKGTAGKVKLGKKRR